MTCDRKINLFLNISIVLFLSMFAPYLQKTVNVQLSEFHLKNSLILFFSSFFVYFFPCALTKALRWDYVEISSPSLFRFPFNLSRNDPSQLGFIFSLSLLCSSFSLMFFDLFHDPSIHFIETKGACFLLFLLGCGFLLGVFIVSALFSNKGPESTIDRNPLSDAINEGRFIQSFIYGIKIRWKKSLIIIISFFILVFLFNLYKSNNDAFRFVEYSIKNNTQIELITGKVKSVNLSLFGEYLDKRYGQNQVVSMKINIIGEKGNCSANITIVKSQDAWTIKNISVENK